jgi:DNA repair exonuclease SbcCD nuclease subunit
MPRFLHIADIHLGFDKYDSPTRTRDFFEALRDVVQRYGIDEGVDFVLIAGDLFEHRQIMPAVLNHAQLCLSRLQEAKIPVLAIEGNHDYRPYGTNTSWLRYLADWDLLILLEPSEDGELEPWTPETKQGGYLDLNCGVRVIGSRWYGASAAMAIATLAEKIKTLPPGPGTSVMMFHHGLEGYVSRYAGALRYADFLPLKDAGVDYLALGHIHRHYQVEEWIFNPGSLEANSVAESQDQFARGAYLVSISPTGIQADLKQDYCQRPIFRLTIKATPQQSVTALEKAAVKAVKAVQPQCKDAIIELRIQGTIGFERQELDIRALKQTLQTQSEALIFLLKFEATGVEYQTFISDAEELPSRIDIERSVFKDLISQQTQYRDRADYFTQGLIDLKARVLSQEAVGDLYQYIETLLQANTTDSD